tara:strand:+ start:1604 stop:1846 length:243 start_codon:yes stop_codon:yes gene_type:complete
MLEKYLKLLFSFNVKKNINLFLIILVLLISALLFFGNFNLVEGLICNNSSTASIIPGKGNSKKLENINNEFQGLTQSCPE